LKSEYPHKSLSIGIGGNIGSGKTTVVKEFTKLFYKDDYKVKIIDADQLAWKIYRKGTRTYRKIVKNFGTNILGRNSEIDRQKLAQIVFSNKTKLDKLNKLVHPELIKIIKSELQNQTGKNKILDAALLFDWGKKIPVTYRILVEAQKIRKVENMRKRGYNTNEVKTRLKNQMVDKDMEELTDFVVNNCGTLSELKKKTKMLYEIITSK
jgi:dephospho-CoA kinase